MSTSTPSKAFLDEISDLAEKLRQEIEAHAAGIDPSPDAIKARRKRVLSGDFAFFAYTYFPHHIRGEPSTFQAHCCQLFPKLLFSPQGAKHFWVAPRGECKSSLLGKIGVVYVHVIALLQQASIRREVGWRGKPPVFIDYINLLGAETRLPTKLMEVSKVELSVNAALAMDFPDVTGRGSVWKVGEYVGRTGVKVEPFGAEQAIRGTFSGASRPKLLIPDDLITDREAKSPTERDNRWHWLEAAVDYLGPPDGSVKLCGAGTILNADDPISRARQTIGYQVHHFKAIERLPTHMDLWEQCEQLIRNEDKRVENQLTGQGKDVTDKHLPSWQFYLKHKKKMDKGALTSWPSVRSLYWLMKQRAKNPRSFGTEMQGEARNDEDRVFTDIQFWVSRLKHWVYLAGCDPSMGKSESADPSAMVVGGLDVESKTLHICEASIKRRLPTQLSADMRAMQREYHIQGWGFENNSAFEFMRTRFIQDALDHQVILPLIPFTETVPLDVRIESMEPFINGAEASILFHSGLSGLLSELHDFPLPQPGHHYDGLSALYLLFKLAATRRYAVPSIKTARHRGREPVKRTRYRGY